jgi:hypothetical protein
VSINEFRASPDGRRSICLALVGDTAQALGELIDGAAKPT